MTGSQTGRSGFFIKLAMVMSMVTFLSWTPSVPANASSDLEVSGFVIVQETGSGSWEIKARNASYVGEKMVLLSGVSARMMSDGTDQVSVVSEAGRFETDRLVLYLEGDVVIDSRWGSRLHAPEVQWNGSEDYIEASGGVTLRRGSVMIYGRTARYVVDSGTALNRGGVRTVLTDTEKSRR